MKKFILLVIAILFLIGCDNNSGNKMSSDAVALSESIDVNSTISSAKSFTTSNRKTSGKQTLNSSVKDKKKFIKTGNLSFETTDLKVTKAIIVKLLKKSKGYISNDSEYKSNDRISNTISVRIPSLNFDNFIEELSIGVENFDNKNINISDVTEQFLDVQVRLKTKKTLEIKYLDILKKARTVREILDVERELAKLRGDIEAIEGRLNYLKNQVLFSTLSITFYKKIKENEELGFVTKLVDAFKGGFENLSTFFLSVINIWPFIIILSLVFFYLRKRIF